MDINSIQTAIEGVLSIAMRIFMVGAFMWVVGSIMWVFPKIVSNRSIKVVNLLLAAVVTAIVLLAILFGPTIVVNTINESYDMAMPGITQFTSKIITDVTDGYTPEHTVVGTALYEPIITTQPSITATPDINADGGAAVTTPTIMQTTVYVEPTTTPFPTATATPIVTIAPTFDFNTWEPGTPAPTPIIGE